MTALGPYREPPKLHEYLVAREPITYSLADDLIERCCRLMRDGHRQPKLVIVSAEDYEDILKERASVVRSSSHISPKHGHPIRLHGPAGPLEIYVGNVDEPALGWLP